MLILYDIVKKEIHGKGLDLHLQGSLYRVDV